jgi:undecaprenyl-diphosphatase
VANREVDLLLFHLVVLALIQGITEFLPISSSAHLILVPIFGDWPDQGLIIDIALHVGTLLAVVVYFWRDVLHLFKGLFNLLTGRGGFSAGLVINLVIATLPVMAAGLFVHRYAGDMLRNPEIIAWTTLIFGILLYFSDHFSLTVKRIEHMSFGNAFVIGMAQVLSLLPGTSRSGITMTAGRILGYERPEAARFSLLLSIPTILGAGAMAFKDLMGKGDVRLESDAYIACGLSFVAALISITVMMIWLKRATFTPFVVYRVVLGILLLFWFYG